MLPPGNLRVYLPQVGEELDCHLTLLDAKAAGLAREALRVDLFDEVELGFGKDNLAEGDISEGLGCAAR